MGTMKRNRIIAVDTNLGTNFLISACDHATVSELRGLIQKGHYSCFPEHGSINVLALMVEYSQQHYHVTDSLLIGQIFRKRWNKIRAVVSSVSLKAVSTLHSSKSVEAESLAVKKVENQCPALDDTLLAGTKSLGVDGPSNKDFAHSPNSLLCGEKVLKDANDMLPEISNSQASRINQEEFRCHLLSREEGPYTQSHSQLELATRAAGSKEVLDKGHKCRKRKCTEEEVLEMKRNQAEGSEQVDHNFSNEGLSSGEKSPTNIKGDFNMNKHNGDQCMQETVCREEYRENFAFLKRDAQFAETYKKREKKKLQADNIMSAQTDLENDSSLRKHSKDPPSPNSEVFVENNRKLKTGSADCPSPHNDTVEANEALGKAQEEGGLFCAKMSADKDVEGTEEVILNSGDRAGKLDLSMSHPIQINDHSILLSASLSGEVVLETQESDMQSKDGKAVKGEEVYLQKSGPNVFEHTAKEPHSNFATKDPLVPQESMTEELPSQKDKNMTSINVNNVAKNLAFLAEEKETPNSTPYVPLHPPSKGLDIEKNNDGNDIEKLGVYNDQCHGQVHEICHAGGSHDVQKKKKRRKKKILEIHKVSVQKDGRFVALCRKGQDIQGLVNPKKDAKESAVLVENPTKTCNNVLQEHGPTQLQNIDTDSKKKQRQNATILNAVEQNCKEPSFAGDETVTIEKILIDQTEAVQLCKGDHIQVCSKEGCQSMRQESLQQDAERQSGGTRRKKKKRRKEHPLPCPEGVSGEISPKMTIENNHGPFFIKELPNVLRLNTTKEGELRRNKKIKFADEQVTKKNSKKEMIETDPNVRLMQEQGQDNTSNDREPQLKDGLVESFSTRSPPKDFSQEGLGKTKPSFDVFDFDSSETVNRPKENCIDTEVTSNPEADNLEKLCSVAVKLVEEGMLNSSKMTIRKSSRKSVHPKRWITVLSERLTWNRTSNNNSKKQHVSIRRKPITEGTGLPKGGEHNHECLYADEEMEESSAIGDGKVACPAGCGRLYTKKTSAYYRHSKMCSGGN